jgi:deoxyribose-phosphate aldolase
VDTPAPPPAPTYDDLARITEHLMLAPNLKEDDLIDGCRMAIIHAAAAVCVQPSNVDTARRILDGSIVALGSVVAFPHGGSTTAVKLYETRDLIRRGVSEVNAVLNIGKLVDRNFQYIENELLQLAAACHDEGAALKVIFDTPCLNEEQKLVACKICKRSSVDFAVTATGCAGAPWTNEDLELLLRKCTPFVKVEAAHQVCNLEQALDLKERGVARIATACTESILSSWRARLTPAAT